MSDTTIKLYQYDGLNELPTKYSLFSASCNDALSYPTFTTIETSLTYKTLSKYNYLYDTTSKTYYWIKSISYEKVDDEKYKYIIYTGTRLLNDKVLGCDFYLNQLTLLLKRSYGVPEQVKLYVDILNQIEEKERTLLNLIGKYNEITGMYLPDIDKINSYSTTESEILDVIGNILNISRTITFSDESTITLNNSEFFILIYMYINKNNYDGRLKTLSNVYDNIYKLVKKLLGFEFQIKIFSDYSNSGSCLVGLQTDKEDSNLVKLFNNDYFIIKSVGITYNKSLMSFNKVGYFDSNEFSEDFKKSHCNWDDALWG